MSEKKEDTKLCPVCAETIKTEARICHFCGARFQIERKGYCTHCHNEVDVDDNGKCKVCGNAVLDERMVSNVVEGAQPGVGAPAALPVTPIPQAVRQVAQTPNMISPGVNTSSQVAVGRRTGAPYVYGVLHLLLAGLFLFYLIKDGLDFRDFAYSFSSIVLILGVGVLPIAAILLFLRSKAGYFLTFAFGIICLAFWIYRLVVTIQYWQYVSGTTVIGMLIADFVRFLYPIIAANSLKKNMHVDLR